GCKGDCPVNVDVATYKAEFLSHYWHGRVRPLGAFVFGWIDKWATVAAIAPRIANGFVQLPGVGALIKKLVGIASERTLPAFARKTFRATFAKHAETGTNNKRVMLWPDTFNNKFRPDTLNAAGEALEAC